MRIQDQKTMRDDKKGNHEKLLLIKFKINYLSQATAKEKRIC